MRSSVCRRKGKLGVERTCQRYRPKPCGRNMQISVVDSSIGGFQEAFRVLKPGGRIAVSAIVATADLSEEVRVDFSLYAGCMACALSIEQVEQMLASAGFSSRKAYRRLRYFCIH